MTAVSGLSSIASSTLAATTQQSRPKSAIDVAADLFGMSTTDLTSELKSGKSLTDVASEQGVSSDDLVSALVSTMPKDLAASGDPTEIATTIAEQVGLPQGGPGGPGGVGGPGMPPPPPPADASDSSDSATASSGSTTSVLDELSTLLGTDSDTLTGQLTSGTSLADLLGNAGVSMTSLANVLQTGLLLDETA
ncbi:hypothetical protein SAMN05443575_2480 [Jatrophihabitans endophyticus]|uniref:Uncharacterized protein n=1 Tax=Jatrophihabitans endophyticus TaxID=1206085 RepID=A0A1M5LKK8_9ACTN|nr:hypothetical protein [Jatrophihabitans endophyticus]SHG65571.1 hypothetical protein SAMN05443575_2480 [Jatrophihabitans endophyticus]